jgi:hypothetical protein
MSDSIDIIRQRSELAHALPELLGSDSAARLWREDVITLLTEIDRLRAALAGKEAARWDDLNRNDESPDRL